MSTRALTVIYHESGQPIVTIYCHSDGYPDGHGADLAKILKDRTLVSGIQIPEQKNASNGMSCLAATIVAELKTGIGDIYLMPRGINSGQEFEYHIYEDRVEIMDIYCSLDIEDLKIFSGSWNKFYNYCNRIQNDF